MAGGTVSWLISAAAGGELKSLMLVVNRSPPWQLWQFCCSNSWRPAAMSARVGPGRSRVRGSGPFGVRTAARTHSRIAVMAGTAVLLPGSVTVTCWRSALALASELTTHGGELMSPLSPMISPWLGSSVLVAGGGIWHATGAASAPGPETLRTLASKSSTSSKIAE